MPEGQSAKPKLESCQSIIAVPSEVEPQIPSQYWSPEAVNLLVVTMLIRSVATLIEVLTPLIANHSDKNAPTQ
jgi:hypothetical protein